MTQNYNRPRQRARSFGAGLLSGGALSQEGVMNQLQENIQFRLQSVRGMLMGQGGDQGVSPVERRQEIRNRRQQLLGGVDSPLSGGGSGGSNGSNTGGSGTGVGSRGSGSIGQSGTQSSTNDSTTNKDSTPSMSEVDKGTKARATDRGFGN